MKQEEQTKIPIPRATRNTAKQSILILGQPDFLYQTKTHRESKITFDGKTKSLGNLSDDIYLKLEDISKGTDVKLSRVVKSKKVPQNKIEGFKNISIQKYKKDTMIVVPASDESALIEKVSQIKNLLESKGIITQERCNWICITDKAKTNATNNEILEKESIVKIKTPVHLCDSKMSDKTKELREMAIKSINKSNEGK